MHVGFTSDSESFAALPPIDAMWHGAPGEIRTGLPSWCLMSTRSVPTDESAKTAFRRFLAARD